MGWKEKAERDLKKYTGYKKTICALQKLIKELRGNITSVGGAPLELVPARGKPGAREERIATCIDEIRRCEHEIEIRNVLVKRVEAGMDELTEEHRQIIRCVFFGEGKAFQLEAALYTSHASIYRQRTKALEAYATAVGYKR